MGNEQNETHAPPIATVKPPAHVTGTARKEWRRIVGELQKQSALNPADLALIASYATAYGRWVDAEKSVAKDGTIVKTKSGNFIQNPYLGVANSAMKLCNKYGRELGFSPLARQEVKSKAGKRLAWTPSPASTTTTTRQRRFGSGRDRGRGFKKFRQIQKSRLKLKFKRLRKPVRLEISGWCPLRWIENRCEDVQRTTDGSFMTTFKTTGQIASDLNTTRDAIQHVVKTRNIEPDSRAGN